MCSIYIYIYIYIYDISRLRVNAESDLFVMSRDVGVYVFIEPDFADNSLFGCYSASERSM